MLKINVAKIDFVESMNNYVAIHHSGTETIAFLERMKGRIIRRTEQQLYQKRTSPAPPSPRTS